MRAILSTLLLAATAVLLLATTAPLQAVSPALSRMVCRGGASADVERQGGSVLLWRLAKPVGNPETDAGPLGENECRWYGKRPDWYAQRSFNVLYSCCVSFEVDRVAAKIKSGTPFTVFGYGRLGKDAPADHFDVRGVED